MTSRKPPPMRRISIVGTSGSGKSTLARQLAERLSIPYVELDALHCNPNWIESPEHIFRERVMKAVTEDAWVIDGNYQRVQPEIWARADTVIWLNFRFRTVFWQVLKRTSRRVIKGESCCNGNRESFWKLWARDSILLWVMQTYGRHRREYPQRLAAYRARGGNAVVLRSPKEAREWVLGLRDEVMR